MSGHSSRSPLATDHQRDVEKLALRLIEDPKIRAARETARAVLLADPVAQTPDGRLGLDRALDQWVLALVMRVINADPWRPKVVWNVYNPPRHWFGHTYQGAAVAIDNPDNSNREIPIDGASSYEIRGRFGSPATQFTIEIVTDFDGYAGIGRTLKALTTQQIVTDSAGNFIITVDDKPAGDRVNHFQCEHTRQFIFSRDSMANWQQVPTALTVERVAGPSAPAARSEAQIVADIVDSLPVWIRFWVGFKDDFLGYPAPNKLIGPNGRPGGWGFLVGGRFKIEDDEAVVITTTDGGATSLRSLDHFTGSGDAPGQPQQSTGARQRGWHLRLCPLDARSRRAQLDRYRRPARGLDVVALAGRAVDHGSKDLGTLGRHGETGRFGVRFAAGHAARRHSQSFRADQVAHRGARVAVHRMRAPARARQDVRGIAEDSRPSRRFE
jgi:hypothetical protein